LIGFEKIEAVFFDVLYDLRDYLEDLTLVGGWMPYVYSRFLWSNLTVNAITTIDIDFGFGGSKPKTYPETIFDTLSPLDYKERHIQMDRLYPVVLYKQGKIPVEFITFPDIKDEIINKFVGRQISINKIEKFDFLLEHKIPVLLKDKTRKTSYKIYCPKPSAFLYHKLTTFIERGNMQKRAKDLFYVYFVLRYAPHAEVIIKEASGYKQSGYFKEIPENLDKYFGRKTSEGCLMVEKENGSDEFIYDLRQDIFERFENLRKALKT